MSFLIFVQSVKQWCIIDTVKREIEKFLDGALFQVAKTLNNFADEIVMSLIDKVAKFNTIHDEIRMKID